MRILNGLMAALFIFGAAVQYNDPDPAAWMAIYLAAAAACLMTFRKQTFVWLPAAILAGCIIWALSLMPSVVGDIPFLDMFAEWEMKDVGVEQSREMYGLLIIGVWMLVIVVANFRSRGRRTSASE